LNTLSDLYIGEIWRAKGFNCVIAERVDEINFTEALQGHFVSSCYSLVIGRWNHHIFTVTGMRGDVNGAETDDGATDS